MSTKGHVVHANFNSAQCTSQPSRSAAALSSKRPFKRNNSDFFIVASENSESSAKLTPEQRRERFLSRRPKSFRGLLFRTTKQEKQPKTQDESKSKFVNLVSKHLLPLKFVTSLKRRDQHANLDSSDVKSCPNLSKTHCVPIEDNHYKSDSCSVEPERSAPKASPERAANISIVQNFQQPRNSLGNINNTLRIQHLALPNSPNERHFPAVDIFTTSFTRSNSPKSVKSLTREGVCKSAQELPKSPLVKDRQKLIRSFSDIPPTKSIKQSNSSHAVATCLQAKMYKNEHVSQILDYLFIGSVETAYNEPQLCRLEINSLIDMTNMSASQVPSAKKLHCPCMCSQADRHFRSRLIIRIDDDENEDIEQYFSEIDKFIDGARRCGKKVLIFSYNGKSRAPTAAIQYMMRYENFLLRQAYNLLKNQRPLIDVNPGFQDTLERVERGLFPEAKPSISFSNDYLNIADPQAIKCAWVDCSDS